VKSLRHVVPLLVVLTLAAMLSGCSKNATPTGVAPLDQAPPAAPSQIATDTGASTGSTVLEWTPSSSANAAGYEIYQYSPNPDRESAYVLVGQTEAATTHYELPWTSQTAAYYRLRTTSATGVKSEWSATVLVSSAGPGPTENPEGINEH